MLRIQVPGDWVCRGARRSKARSDLNQSFTVLISLTD